MGEAAAQGSVHGTALRRDPIARSAAGLPATTVLVADDDVGMLELLTEVLRARGYHVLTARNGAEGIELTEQDDLQIDCMVTDQVMPGATGRSLAERARLRWTKLPVLIISGYAIDRDDVVARLGPQVEFLRKPFTPDKLLDSVGALMTRANGNGR